MIKKVMLGVIACLMLCHSTTLIAGSNDIAKVGADAIVEAGTTVDNVAVVFGDLTVNGTVLEDVAVVGGDLTVGPTGKILGNTAVVFGEIIKAEGAEINKNVVEMPIAKKIKSINLAFPILGFFALGAFLLMLLGAMAVIVILIAHLFTNRVGSTSFYIQTYPWKSFLYGFLLSLLIFPSILFLLVSIVGIPLIPLFIILLIVVSLFAYATMCQLFGLKFFKWIKKPNQHILWEVFVGYLIMCVIILIPYIGWLLKTIIWMTGLGATFATRFGKKW